MQSARVSRRLFAWYLLKRRLAASSTRSVNNIRPTVEWSVAGLRVISEARLAKSKRSALLGPIEGQPAVVGELVCGQADWVAAIQDRGDDVGSKEAEADDT